MLPCDHGYTYRSRPMFRHYCSCRPCRQLRDIKLRAWAQGAGTMLGIGLVITMLGTWLG